MATATGTLNAVNDTVTLAYDGDDKLLADFSGTHDGMTVLFEISPATSGSEFNPLMMDTLFDASAGLALSGHKPIYSFQTSESRRFRAVPDINNGRRVRVTLTSKTNGSMSVTLTSFSSSGSSTSGSSQIEGNVANNAADSGNPVKVGFVARNPDSMPADVDAGDRVDGQADLKGRPIVYLGTTLDATNDKVGVIGFVPQDSYTKAQATNSTDTAFPATIPTATTPVASATRAVITWAARESLLLNFFGTGADDSTFDYRVVGWQQTASGLWIATPLAQGTATLSTLVGVAGHTVVATERFADTIDVDFGIGIVQNSPVANAVVASVEVPAGPYDFVEVLFDLVTATAANALYTTF